MTLEEVYQQCKEECTRERINFLTNQIVFGDINKPLMPIYQHPNEAVHRAMKKWLEINSNNKI